MPAVEVQRSSNGRQTLDDVQNEIDGYMGQMQLLHTLPSEEVFRFLSAWSARLTEIGVQLSRSNSHRAKQIITNEIDKVIAECDRQFRQHSRIQASLEMDLKMIGGQT